MNANDNPNEQNCLSQTKQILAYLREGHTITSRQASDMFGCDRLAARISDIEDIVGYPPERKKIRVQNKKKKWVHVSQYWLRKEDLYQ